MTNVTVSATGNGGIAVAVYNNGTSAPVMNHDAERVGRQRELRRLQQPGRGVDRQQHDQRHGRHDERRPLRVAVRGGDHGQQLADHGAVNRSRRGGCSVRVARRNWPAGRWAGAAW
jgi:hypothetical protein